jgi:AbrB family looped-hinge helix DNA binding protein
MEVSRITSKGQITIPKAIRERLNLAEGDKVALREFLDSMAKEAMTKGVTEEGLLNDLKQVREDMWNERK